MPAVRPFPSALRLGAGLALLALLGTGLTACADGSAEATVSRIVDGDTIVARYAGTEKTVRLLSVDTPETKDPDKPVECLGPEATAFLERRLPVGSTISLQFDTQHQDAYGRVLAAVFDADGQFVDADIARAGLGVAKRYEPNTRFYDRVLEAQREAERSRRGLYDPDAACTLPAKVAAATAGVTTAEVYEPEGQSAAAIAAVLLALQGNGEDLDGLHDLLGAPATGIILRAYSPARLLAFRRQVDDAAARGDRRASALTAAHRSAASAESEAERKAEEKKSAEKRAAEKHAKRAKPPAANHQPAPKKDPGRNPPAPKRHESPPPHHQPAKKPPAAPHHAPPKKAAPGGGYPGYHGPRCYAPGGKTWKPCP